MYLNVKVFGDALASIYAMFYQALDEEDPADTLRGTRLFMYDTVKRAYLADLDQWREDQDEANAAKRSPGVEPRGVHPYSHRCPPGAPPLPVSI